MNKTARFFAYSFVTNLCVSMERTLSAHSMLSTVGEASTTNILAYNYIGKDLIGQLLSLPAMLMIGSSADQMPKTTGNIAVGLEQTSILVESITPRLGLYWFLPFAGGSSALSCIAYTGFGSLNTKLMQKLSPSTMGDMYSKLTVCSVLGSSMGTVLGLLTIGMVDGYISRLMLLPLLGGVRWYFMRKMLKLLD